MSTARRFALVVTVASALVLLNAAAAQAQIGPTNPSGGTSLRQTTLEGTGSFSPAGILARNLSFQTGWHSWFGAVTTSRFAPSVAGWTSDWRSLSAVVRRPAGRR